MQHLFAKKALLALQSLGLKALHLDFQLGAHIGLDSVQFLFEENVVRLAQSAPHPLDPLTHLSNAASALAADA
jgi:hypothetical protein